MPSYPYHSLNSFYVAHFHVMILVSQELDRILYFVALQHLFETIRKQFPVFPLWKWWWEFLIAQSHLKTVALRILRHEKTKTKENLMHQFGKWILIFASLLLFFCPIIQPSELFIVQLIKISKFWFQRTSTFYILLNKSSLSLADHLLGFSEDGPLFFSFFKNKIVLFCPNSSKKLIKLVDTWDVLYFSEKYLVALLIAYFLIL